MPSQLHSVLNQWISLQREAEKSCMLASSLSTCRSDLKKRATLGKSSNCNVSESIITPYDAAPGTHLSPIYTRLKKEMEVQLFLQEHSALHLER